MLRGDGLDPVQRLAAAGDLDGLELLVGHRRATEAVGRQDVDDLAVDVEAEAFLGFEAADLMARGTELGQLLGHPLGAAGPLACIAEDVDVGRGSADLAGLDREQRDHQPADQAPAHVLVL
jgi:hypothetical protein